MRLFLNKLSNYVLHGIIKTRISRHLRFISAPSQNFLGESLLQEQSLDEIVKNYNFVTNVVEPWAKKQPDHPALVLTDGESNKVLTYAELLSEADSLAVALASSSHAPTPTCALVILPKVSPWWVINLTGSICGTIISPGTQMLSSRDIAYRACSCQADAIFCDATTMAEVDYCTKELPWRVFVGEDEEYENQHLKDGWLSYHALISTGKSLTAAGKILRRHQGDEIAQIFFTSGTTGNPKMVPHSQVGLGLGHEATARNWFGLRNEDILWNLSDLGWAKAAYSSLYSPLIVGATIFSHTMPRFSSEAILRTLESYDISVMCLPPTALRSIIQLDLSHFKPKALRKLIAAGEPLNPEVHSIIKKHTGLSIYEGYGQTESTVTCGGYDGLEVKPGKIGKPLPQYDFKIIDENFEELGPNNVGQIAYSLTKGWPYGLFKGYKDNPEENKKVFVNGYYLTGDKAYFDEDGYVCYVGRDDDLITSAGYRIGPFEVESALIEHPAVRESAVVASPETYRGHVVKAFIVLTEEAEKTKDKNELVKEIQEFAKSIIAPYKYPRKIEFVKSLPKTISGKIKRVELRRKELETQEKN